MGRVFEGEEGDDVAVGAEVGSGVEFGSEAGEVLCAFLFQLIGVIAIADEGVAHVELGAVFAGDVPAAPAFFHGAAVVGDEGAGLEDGHAGGLGIDGADDDAGDSEGAAGLVALEAGVAAVEAGFGDVFNVEGVEDDSLFGIEGGEFEDVSATDPTDGDFVVEV